MLRRLHRVQPLLRPSGRPSLRAAPIVLHNQTPSIPTLRYYVKEPEAPSKSTGGGPSGGDLPDSLSEGRVRGRTGGGEPLSSSKNAPPRPKILNASVKGNREGITQEQKDEVDRHNADFEKKHGRSAAAQGDKVDEKFWSGGGTRETEERGGKEGKKEAKEGKSEN